MKSVERLITRHSSRATATHVWATHCVVTRCWSRLNQLIFQIYFRADSEYVDWTKQIRETWRTRCHFLWSMAVVDDQTDIHTESFLFYHFDFIIWRIWEHKKGSCTELWVERVVATNAPTKLERNTIHTQHSTHGITEEGQRRARVAEKRYSEENEFATGFDESSTRVREVLKTTERVRLTFFVGIFVSLYSLRIRLFL